MVSIPKILKSFVFLPLRVLDGWFCQYLAFCVLSLCISLGLLLSVSVCAYCLLLYGYPFPFFIPSFPTPLVPISSISPFPYLLSFSFTSFLSFSRSRNVTSAVMDLQNFPDMYLLLRGKSWYYFLKFRSRESNKIIVCLRPHDRQPA